MSTPFSTVNAVFFDLIEEDSNFFNYYNATDEESYVLAVERANSLLMTAANRMTIECEPDVDLLQYSQDALGAYSFDVDLTVVEINLLANLQYEAYLKRDIAKLKAFSVNFTPTDLQVFSPANDRKTFMEMYNCVCDENKIMMDRYKSKDRLTNKSKYIDYASYDEE